MTTPWSTLTYAGPDGVLRRLASTRRTEDAVEIDLQGIASAAAVLSAGSTSVEADGDYAEALCYGMATEAYFYLPDGLTNDGSFYGYARAVLASGLDPVTVPFRIVNSQQFATEPGEVGYIDNGYLTDDQYTSVRNYVVVVPCHGMHAIRFTLDGTLDNGPQTITHRAVCSPPRTPATVRTAPAPATVNGVETFTYGNNAHTAGDVYGDPVNIFAQHSELNYDQYMVFTQISVFSKTDVGDLDMLTIALPGDGDGTAFDLSAMGAIYGHKIRFKATPVGRDDVHFDTFGNRKVGSWSGQCLGNGFSIVAGTTVTPAAGDLIVTWQGHPVALTNG